MKPAAPRRLLISYADPNALVHAKLQDIEREVLEQMKLRKSGVDALFSICTWRCHAWLPRAFYMYLA
jgi:hypothetical protein